MLREAVAVAAPILFCLAVVVVAIVLRPRLQRRLYPGVPLDEWRSAARELAWSDRWKVARANGSGRATEPRLAGYAVQRAEVMIPAVQRNARFGFVRWTFLILGAALAVDLVFVAVQMANDPRAREDMVFFWYLVVVLIAWTVYMLLWGRLFRRAERRLRRSIALNSAILANARDAGQGGSSDDEGHPA